MASPARKEGQHEAAAPAPAPARDRRTGFPLSAATDAMNWLEKTDPRAAEALKRMTWNVKDIGDDSTKDKYRPRS